MKTRIITLDESGKFNKKTDIRNTQFPWCFIGGFTGEINFTKENEPMDEKQLCNIVDDFLANLVAKYNDDVLCKKGFIALYPQSIHGSNIALYKKNGQELCIVEDAEEVKQFIEYIQENTIEFFKALNLHPYMFINTYEEQQEFGPNIINSNEYENLYERMSLLAVYNQIFWNPGMRVQKINMYIAARSIPVDEASTKGKKEISEFYDVWRRTDHITGGTNMVMPVTTASFYKAAISSMLYDGVQGNHFLNMSYKAFVRSIRYDRRMKEKEYAMLYSADIACSYIRDILKHMKKDNPDSSFGELIWKLSDMGIEVRVKCESEKLFRQMVSFMDNADLVDFYALRYKMEHLLGDNYKEFYLNKWVPKLEARLIGLLEENPRYKSVVIGKMEGYCGEIYQYMRNSRNPQEQTTYEQGLYIGQNILGLLSASQIEVADKYLFRLYDILLGGFNHRGDVGNSKRMILECEIHKKDIGLEEYLEHILRAMQVYFNCFDYKAIVDISCELTDMVRNIEATYKMSERASNVIIKNAGSKCVVQSFVSSLMLLAKMYSNLGQAWAFLGDFDKAVDAFESALERMEYKSPNYYITLSYMLHAYISANRREEYEKYAAIYFDSDNVAEQLELTLKNLQGGFGLYVWVKAYKHFYAQYITEDNKKIILDLIEKVGNLKDTCAHPWELIYMNIYDIVTMSKGIFNIHMYAYVKDYAINCIPHAEATIRIMQLGFKLRTNRELEVIPWDEFVEDYLTDTERMLCEKYIPEFDMIQDTNINTGVVQLKDVLNRLLTYTYN